MSDVRKIKQDNGQSVMMVMGGTLFAWVSREGLSEEATTEQDSE